MIIPRQCIIHCVYVAYVPFRVSLKLIELTNNIGIVGFCVMTSYSTVAADFCDEMLVTAQRTTQCHDVKSSWSTSSILDPEA